MRSGRQPDTEQENRSEWNEHDGQLLGKYFLTLNAMSSRVG